MRRSLYRVRCRCIVGWGSVCDDGFPLRERLMAKPGTITGGCQCGAVRYALHMEPQRTQFCHCRMCQRAVGNVFAALTGVKKDKIEWTAGPPATFASSSLAQRGFCAKCGTPLTFSYNDAEWIYVTIGSLDEPSIAK